MNKKLLLLLLLSSSSSSSPLCRIYKLYIPETNYVPREYSVAAILLLLFMVFISLVSVLNLLYFYISTFRSVCAVPNMAVFCSFLTSCFPGMLITYFLNDFELLLLYNMYVSCHRHFFLVLLLNQR